VRSARLLGLLLVVGAPAVWISVGAPGTPVAVFGAPASTAGETAPGSTPPRQDAPEPAATEPAAPSPAARDGAGEPPDTTPSPFTSTAPRGAIDRARWPASLDIPALSVVAPVGAVGVEAGGELVIPESPRDVGWYQGGAVPGEPGVALLTSHLDTRLEGRGVLAGLVRLSEGDAVLLTATDGTVQRWTVTARTQHRKDELPPELFMRTGEPVLALVTCGGPFDSAARSYRDNVIVWARPA